MGKVLQLEHIYQAYDSLSCQSQWDNSSHLVDSELDKNLMAGKVHHCCLPSVLKEESDFSHDSVLPCNRTYLASDDRLVEEIFRALAVALAGNVFIWATESFRTGAVDVLGDTLFLDLTIISVKPHGTDFFSKTTCRWAINFVHHRSHHCVRHY